jgi:putative transposase
LNEIFSTIDMDSINPPLQILDGFYRFEFNLDNDSLFWVLIDRGGFDECQLHAIGGIEDHIHLIVSIPPKLSIADFAKRIKGSSARYLNQEFAKDNYKFAWQHEYAVFSLGE